MDDFARDLFRRTVAEPYRTKVVERLRLPSRTEREEILKEASYSPVHLRSEDIYIDLITDSGTGAMSDAQWSGLMRGDEAYMHSRNFASFEASVTRRTGFPHVVPTHQGRAAENIVMEVLVKPSQVVLANTHFDTTAAHVKHRGATPFDLVHEAFWSYREQHPFKGNFDLEKLETALERYSGRVALVVITVLNNFACSSPVSLENIREVRRLANKHGVRVFFDACRFAENAFFIKQREPGYAGKSIEDIAREMLSYGDGCWMSAKKDAIVNVGGFIAVRDQALCRRFQERLVLYEGFMTYGGLARRDLEAIAIGLDEAVEEAYLAHRTGQVEYLGNKLEAVGAVVSRPTGGSGVFVDVEAMYPHLGPEKLPGVALCADFYLEGGVRVGAAAFPTIGIDARTGESVTRVFQFARFALPRRVYGKAHLDFVAGVAERVIARAQENPGYRVIEHPAVLGHFFSKFEPLTIGD